MTNELPDRPGFALFVQINDFYHIDFRADPTDEDSLVLPRVATVLKRLRSQYGENQVIFSLPGDFLNPSCLSRMNCSQQIIDLLNVMGLQLATFGNHEFDFDDGRFSPTDLLARFYESDFLWLVSNLIPLGDLAEAFLAEHSFIDSFTIEISPRHSIVVYGLLYKSGYKYGDKEVIRFGDPIEWCQKQLELTKSLHIMDKGVFKPSEFSFVALTHQTLEEDEELARQCPELRLIMGGHDHEVLEKVRAGKDSTLIVKGKSNARTLRLNFVVWIPRENVERFEQEFGSFENAFNEQIGPVIINPAINVALTGYPEVPKSVHRIDPDVQDYLAMLSTGINFDSPGVVAHRYEGDGCSVVASIVLDTIHPGFRKLVDSDDATKERIQYWLNGCPHDHYEVILHSPIELDTDDDASRKRSTNFGNFVADVLAGRLRKRNPERRVAEIGLVNGGSFRLNRNIVKGEAINKAILCDLLLHSNEVLLYSLPGATLVSILKRSFEELWQQGNFLQVSGLKITVEEKKIASVLQVDEAEKTFPLDPDRLYTVATTSYVATHEDAYGEFFPEPDDILEPSIHKALEAEIRAQAPTLPVDESPRWLIH